MPRPNPEVQTQGTISTTVSGTGSVTTTSRNTEVMRRTYSSANTVGFPNVKPLPFHNFEMQLRTRTLGDLLIDRKRTSNPNLSGYYTTTGKTDASGLAFGSVATHCGFDPLAGSVEALAKSRVIAKIQRLKANVAQDMAEHRQVSRMFFDTTRRFRNIMTALRRGDPRELVRELELRKRHKRSLLARGPFDIRSSAPRIWLEAQYGWLPLLGSVYEGITGFYRRVEEGYPIRAVGTARSTLVDNPLGDTVGVVSSSDTRKREIRCKYIIEYEVDASYLANANDWGITNPALLAWELVPYSFVVDWFFPVGDWLSQVGYSLGLFYRRGMKTGLIEATTLRSLKPNLPTTDYQRTVKGSEVFKSVWMKRSILGSFPSPGKPVLDLDGLRGKRIANALALLAVAFDRK